jgi:hypothetical protein
MGSRLHGKCPTNISSRVEPGDWVLLLMNESSKLSLKLLPLPPAGKHPLHVIRISGPFS